MKYNDWFTVFGKGTVDLKHKEGIVAISLLGIFVFRSLIFKTKSKQA